MLPEVPVDAPALSGDSFSYTSGEVTLSGVILGNPATGEFGIEYALNSPKAKKPFVFRELLDGDGLIVWQEAACGNVIDEGQGFDCWGERATRFLSATGLPGALGIGPLLTGSGLPVTAHSELTTLTLKNVGIDDHCTRWRWESDAPGPWRMLPWTAVNASFMLCPGQLFPRSFETNQGPGVLASSREGVTFVRESVEEGPARDLPWTRGSDDRQLQIFDPGIPVYADQGIMSVGFPMEELIEKAIQNSQSFESHFTKSGSQVLAYHHFLAQTANPPGGLVTSTTFRASITVGTSGRSEGYAITMEKTVDNVSGLENVSYRVVEEGTKSTDGLSQPPPSARLGEAITTAVALTGADFAPVQLAALTFTAGFQLPPWCTAQSDGGLLAAPMLYVGSTDPEATQAGDQFYRPYEVVFEGQTGRLLHYDYLPK